MVAAATRAAAGLSLQVGGCAAGRGRKGRAPGGVYAGSGPAAAPARGASQSVLEEGHLEPLAEEDFQSSGDPACEQDEGVVGAPARLDAIVVPAVHLLVVDADAQA